MLTSRPPWRRGTVAIATSFALTGCATHTAASTNVPETTYHPHAAATAKVTTPQLQSEVVTPAGPPVYAAPPLSTDNGTDFSGTITGPVGLVSSAGYHVLAAASTIAFVGATVTLNALDGTPLVNISGVPITTVTDSHGGYTFKRIRGTHAGIVTAQLPNNSGSLQAVAPHGTPIVDLSLDTTLTTQALLVSTVKTQADLDRLGGDQLTNVAFRIASDLTAAKVAVPTSLQAADVTALLAQVSKQDAGFQQQITNLTHPVAPTSFPSVAPLPTVVPGATPGASATPAATPTPALFTGPSTSVTGTVYDETNAPVTGATVTVNSLDASVRYTHTVTTQQGAWSIGDVPQNLNVEVVATQPGWTSRRRVNAFSTPSTFDFGGTTDVAGAPYFISNFPEIATVEPGYDVDGVDNTNLAYKLTLSEPLDALNQGRFANALRLFPANVYAVPDNDNGGAGTAAYAYDLKDQKLAPFAASLSTLRPVDVDATSPYSAPTLPNHPNNVGGGASTNGDGSSNVPWDYAIKNGTSFLNDPNVRTAVTWDASGTAVTLTLNAPLIADHVNQARYQVGLVVTSLTDRIVDATNNQLGLDQNGGQSAYPPHLGALLHGTIKQPALALDLPTGAATNATNRWLATHQDAARFAVAIDATAPQLLGIGYSKAVGRSSRFELTFSEPMAAYNGRPGGHVGPGIAQATLLQGLTFAVSDHAGGTTGLTLAGTAAYGLNPGAGSTLRVPFGNAQQDLAREFYLAQPTSASAPMGQAATGALPTADLASALTTGNVFSYGTDVSSAEGTGGAQATDGDYLLAVEASNPRTLYVYIIGRTSVFDQRIVELKARVAGADDPAGNAIQSGSANSNELVVSVQG